MELNFYEIKNKSEVIIEKYGANINEKLPLIEYQGLRDSDEIIKRVTIMAGMVYIAHEAPPFVIKKWIEEQNLYKYLTEFEQDILEKEEQQVTSNEKLKLKWYVESMWALVWVLRINNNFQIYESVGDDLILMVPDVKKNQYISMLRSKVTMRDKKEIYEQVDLYYRLHWHCVDARIKGSKHSKFDEGTIMERRKALDWVVTPDVEWDDIDLST